MGPGVAVAPRGDGAAHGGPLVLGHDVADAAGRATPARVILPGFEIEAIVVGKFLAFGDWAEGMDPEAVLIVPDFGIRIARVVDEACLVLDAGAIEVPFLVERENVDGAAAVPLRLFDLRRGPVAPIPSCRSLLPYTR